MSIKNKNFNLYYTMNIILSALAIGSFLLAFIIIKINFIAIEEQESINLLTIANYLDFITKDCFQIAISIALHNFFLAVTTYLLSMISCGVLGSFSIAHAFFSAGLVIASSMNILTIIFVGLEVFGIGLSVFGGTRVFNKRKKFNFSMQNILKFSLRLILSLGLIYLIAAYIEASLIKSLWR